VKKILVSSVGERSGKTSIALTLALILSEKKYRVGYFKTFDTETYDVDLAKGFGFESGCGVILDRPYAEFLISEDPYKLKKTIISEFEKLSADKDVVIIEGAQSYVHGQAAELSDLEISKLLDAEVLAIAKYYSDFIVDDIILAKRHFEERMKKVIINQMSGYKRSYVASLVEKVFLKHGIELAGIIPTDPGLMGIPVSEIAAATGSEYLVKADKDEIVEQVVVGAMKPEAALTHMRNARNFVFVTGGDRSDLMLLAIESGAKCIVATGNMEPPAMVLSKATESNVAVLLSRYDTATTLELIQRTFGRVGIRKENLSRARELFEKNVNVEGLLWWIMI
jgi:hypothetical protein